MAAYRDPRNDPLTLFNNTVTNETTTYVYDGQNRLVQTIDPDGFTNSVVYNAIGKQAQTIDKLGRVTSYAYDLLGNLASVTYPDATTESYAYDAESRRTFTTNRLGYFTQYQYDAAGRLTNTIAPDPSTNATFYDAAGRVARSVDSLGTVTGFTYDGAGRRVSVTNAYGITGLQAVTTFAYDANGNQTNIARNSTSALTVTGTSSSPATNVTVNTTNAILYADQTFAATNFTPANGANTYTAIAKDNLGRQSTNAITVNLPSTATYTYDLNGNLLGDGTRSFTYDDENELIQVSAAAAWQSQFVYDGKMRRRITKEFTWQGGAWVQTNEVHYVYDGSVVIQERDINNLPQVGYTRGNDLSRTLQGAGGIGGLLAFSQLSTLNPQHFYYHADVNGNVTAMVNAQQIIVAKYLYDPFGGTLSLSGPLASVNTYRFSSKEYHQNSGLVYYLYRFYDANLQRWLNRDPLGERGGNNTFSAVHNNFINYYDPNGLLVGALTTIATTLSEIALDNCQSCDCVAAATVAGIAAIQAGYIADLVTDAPTGIGAIVTTAAYLLELGKFTHDAGEAAAKCKNEQKKCPSPPPPPPPPPSRPPNDLPRSPNPIV